MDTHESNVSPEKPVRPPLINGVRICQLVLAAATIALIISAFAAGKPYYFLLALLCLFAAVVKADNVRRVLGAVAVVEGMYFAADLFSKEGGSALRNLLAVAGSVLVFVAISRLRYWESTPQELPRQFRIGCVVVGVLLLTSAAVMAMAPVSSSQWSGSSTKVACGSVLFHKAPTHAWTGVPIVQIKTDCNAARRDRAAFSFLQFEVAIGLLYLGRSVIRKDLTRVAAATLVLLVLAAGGSYGWDRAAVNNADVHNAAFEPWVNRYSTNFSQQSMTNAALRTAVIANDAQAAASACQELIAVDDALAASVNDWPTASSKDDWAAFVAAHRADSQSCFQKTSALAPGAKVSINGQFSNSAAAIKKLQHQITYW